MADEAPQKLVIPVDAAWADGYRTFHADGAVVNFTPHAMIHLSFYSEWQALPTTSEVELENGMMSERKGGEGLAHIHREFQSGMIMNVQVAYGLLKVLELKIKQSGIQFADDDVSIRPIVSENDAS